MFTLRKKHRIFKYFKRAPPRNWEQIGQLSQPKRTAACVSFGKNINVKNVHLSSLYPTALTSTN